MFQGSNRHHVNAVRSLVCGMREAANHRHDRRHSAALCGDSVQNVNEVCGGLVNLIRSELDFNGAPTTVIELNHGVNFLVCVVLIVKHLSAEGLSINPDVPLARRFKQESEGLQVTNEFGRSGLQQSASQRGGAEVAFLRLLDALPPSLLKRIIPQLHQADENHEDRRQAQHKGGNVPPALPLAA